MTGSEAALLESAVARLLQAPIAAVDDIRSEPIVYDAFLAGRELARVRGSAMLAERRVAWSLIEKRTDGPDRASAYLVDNAVREVAAYRSGLLDDLAKGLRAPRLFATHEGADGRLTLWLEDLAPNGRQPHAPDDLLHAARHLGRLAGRWVGRVPDRPWLFRGWVERHSQPAAVADGLRVVTDASGEGRVVGRLGGRMHEAARLIEGQGRIGAVLDALPSTLCHHDAVAANVFATRDADNAPATVLIDWESVGPGAVGADLASLLFASARRGDIPSSWLAELLPAAHEAYRHGLTDVGAAIDADTVALGLHASIALRWTLVRDVARALREGTSVFRGSALHESPEEALDELVALVPVLLDSAAEADRLSR
jgi:hypothetical protein